MNRTNSMPKAADSWTDPWGDDWAAPEADGRAPDQSPINPGPEAGVDADGIDFLLHRVLEGDLAARPTGFLLHLPAGYRGARRLDARLAAAYGSLGHPDLRRLAPAGASDLIRVDEVRDLAGFLAASPAAIGASAMKTLVVERADRMNEAAANAFLKGLEEPTGHTRILLVTDAPARLPATILSRTLRLRARAGDDEADEEVRALLPEETDATDNIVARALLLAAGRPDDAAALIAHGLLDWADTASAWLATAGGRGTPPLPVLSGKAAAPLPVCARVLATLVHGSLMQAALPGETTSTLAGWDSARALAAASRLAPLLQDIDRPGLDGRLRLHRIMVTLAAC